MRSCVPRMRAPLAVSLNVAGLALCRAAILPRAAAARVIRPTMPPVPVMPVVAAMGGMALAARPGVRRWSTVLRRGPGRRTRARGRLRRSRIMVMRRLGPAVRRPTVIVMALVSQGLWPFLMEGQEKPHWRDGSW